MKKNKEKTIKVSLTEDEIKTLYETMRKMMYETEKEMDRKKFRNISHKLKWEMQTKEDKEKCLLEMVFHFYDFDFIVHFYNVMNLTFLFET